MRVLIATVQVPFVRGGAEMLADGLEAALTGAGHETETVRLPFKWYPPERIPEHILAARLYDVTESCGTRIDRVVGLRFPAYLLPHPDKVLWLLHQYRTAYDLWGSELCELTHSPNGEGVRDAIRAADSAFIPEARAIYTIARNVAARLKRFNGLDAEALYHPPPQAALFHCAPAHDFLFFPSRFNQTKRQMLVVDALALCREPVTLRFAGLADDDTYERAIRARIDELRVGDRVTWLGAVDAATKAELYARCLAVVFPPIDEDYGYVTLEAMLSHKPVITCVDSGGPLEFVRHEASGLVVEPTPEALAGAMDRVWQDRAAAVRWGQAARELYEAQGITWERVVATLTRHD